MATKFALRGATAETSGIYGPRVTAKIRFRSFRSAEQQLLSSAPVDVQREVEHRVLEIRETELMATPEEVLQGMAFSALLKWLRERHVSRRSR